MISVTVSRYPDKSELSGCVCPSNRGGGINVCYANSQSHIKHDDNN